MNQFLDPFVGVRISYTKSLPNQHTINNITKKNCFIFTYMY